jgi:hypothetical protein
VWLFGDQYQIRSLGTDQEAIDVLSKLVPDRD